MRPIDADKLLKCEEKRRCTIENMLQFDEAKGYARGMACAIEIVKRGGVDEE